MDKTDHLKVLLLKAKEGCSVSIYQIVSRYFTLVERESKQIWFKVQDETSFEHECYQKIKYAIKSFDLSKSDVSWFDNYIKIKIRKVKIDHVRRRGKTIIQQTSIEALAGVDDEGKYKEFEIDDVLANVEQEALLNDKIALLAKGDPKKLAILNQWRKGCTDNRSISKMLANNFGGKSESYRKAIKRFRTECRAALA